MGQHWSCAGLGMCWSMGWCPRACPRTDIVCNGWLLMHFFSSCLSVQRGSAVPVLAKYMQRLQEASSLLQWIWSFFTTVLYMRKTSLGYPDPFVLFHSSTFFAKGAKLGRTKRAQQVKWFSWLPSAHALMMSLLVFPVSRRAWEVWLHSRVCHTWTSLWCTKGKLYKVHSPGLCFLL